MAEGIIVVQCLIMFLLASADVGRGTKLWLPIQLGATAVFLGVVGYGLRRMLTHH